VIGIEGRMVEEVPTSTDICFGGVRPASGRRQEAARHLQRFE
jgi:hypothetical protein